MSFRVVHTLSHNFQSATRVVRASLRLPLKPDYVLMKIIYAGVNASDVSLFLSILMATVFQINGYFLFIVISILIG